MDAGEGIDEGKESPVHELWARAKPLLGEEYEALKNDPGDVDAQADARSGLRRALKKEEGLKKELEDLVSQLKENQGGSKVQIINSKNVVQGSSISVGGDFRLGDG